MTREDSLKEIEKINGNVASSSGIDPVNLFSATGERGKMDEASLVTRRKAAQKYKKLNNVGKTYAGTKSPSSTCYQFRLGLYLVTNSCLESEVSGHE